MKTPMTGPLGWDETFCGTEYDAPYGENWTVYRNWNGGTYEFRFTARTNEALKDPRGLEGGRTVGETYKADLVEMFRDFLDYVSSASEPTE